MVVTNFDVGVAVAIFRCDKMRPTENYVIVATSHAMGTLVSCPDPALLARWRLGTRPEEVVQVYGFCIR